MNDWGYVIAGWAATMVVIGSYWMWVARKTRRAAAEVAQLEDAA